MATKTFKIGLSNTDKQNMAQDVYERVLALTFAEYDSAETYNKGDFVVYDDLLYKCLADNVTGTWDATKWQQATLQDVVDDVEGAVATVNNKANVDGNYPTMTVGVADQLSPYDESAGDDQDEPFILQATGTGNGTQPDFSTGSIALMKEKQGNTVVVNQLVENGNFADTSGWNRSDLNTSFTVSNNVGTVSGITVTYTALYRDVNVINGHKYLVSAKIKAPSNQVQLLADQRVSGGETTMHRKNSSGTNTLLPVSMIIEITSANSVIRVGFTDTRSSDWTDVSIADVFIVDLTQWFNGDIPQDLLDNPSNFFRYYQGSLAYNEGTLVNANGRYIKCIGRQQWDEEWESGSLNSGGQNVSSVSYIRSKNYVKVIPNKTYYFYGAYQYCYCYDKDKNFIGSVPWRYTGNSSQYFLDIPSDACYIRFSLPGSTYANNTTLSIYYENESGYDQYYQYQVLTNNDTGTEVLRSAGSVKDSKAPDGTIHRLVGNRAYQSGDENDSSLITDGTTTNYPLAEPTTEQGTPFSENLVIDDFGSMDFGGTNGVPQGNLIFYPVDYKAFVDTLYNYTDGTPSNIALKSDLPTAPQTWAESLPGYDATKTQTLKNVEGTLTWVDD